MNERRGLYEKYIVYDAQTGGRVEGVFVLKPDTDPIALEALYAYARWTRNKELKADLNVWLDSIVEESGG